MIGLEARRIGMGVGAVQGQHRHPFARWRRKSWLWAAKLNWPGAAGGTAAASVTASSSRKLFPNIARRLLVPNGCTPVGVRLKAERLPIQRSLRQIADTNDEMI